MIVRSVSGNHLELESEDPLELLRIVQLLHVDATGICKVSVIFIRHPLDEESLYEKFQERAQRELAELDSQLDWTQP